MSENPNCNWVFLKNVADGYEINILKAIFSENSIPIRIIPKELGGYLKITMGMTSYGYDIYVRESDYEKAKAILKYLRTEVVENPVYEKINEDKEEFNIDYYKKKRKKRIWIFLCFYIVPTIILLVVSIITKYFTNE